MKKQISVLFLLLAFIFSTTAHAVEPRATGATPSLTFSGTTAKCVYYIETNDPDDAITVTLRLYRGLTLIESWPATGYGSVSMSKSATITPGATFQLTANVTINGGTPTSSSVSKYY